MRLAFASLKPAAFAEMVQAMLQLIIPQVPNVQTVTGLTLLLLETSQSRRKRQPVSYANAHRHIVGGSLGASSTVSSILMVFDFEF